MDGEMLRFKSRRNTVMLTETNEGTVVRKDYREEETYLRELMVYERLHGSSLPHAQILRSSPLEISMTYLPGSILLEILETQEKKALICCKAWDKLVQWLVDFHNETGLTMTDVNLRNFVYDEPEQTLYGVDFEECAEGDLAVTAARTAAYIQNYAPEKTPIKMETAEYVLQRFSKLLNMDITELRAEAEKQEMILLMRRRNRT